MNNLKNVDVSVIIPTYKRAQKLDRAIESVLNQTFENIEVIIVDDNSDGDEFRIETERTMQKFLDNPKVTYLRHSENRNGSAARNTGIKYSKSKYIGFLDDDDYFLDTKIEKQVRLLEQCTNIEYAAVCCSRIAMFKNYVYDVNRIKSNSTGNYIDTLLSKEDIFAAGSTLLLNRTVFDHVGYFDESFRRHQDYEFLIRFFRSYRMIILDENLVCISVDGIRNYPNAALFHSIKINFFEKFDSDISKLNKEQRKKIYYNQWSEVFLYYFIEKQFSKAKEIYFSNMKEHKQFNLYFLIKCFYAFIEKRIHFLSSLKYKIISLKYRI